MNKSNNPVIAIGIDSGEPSLIEKWMNQGYLPNLQKLKEQGIYGRLENFKDSNVETAWTSFSTGCSPQTTGYWAAIDFIEGTYNTTTRAAYEYEEFPPFCALGDEYKVIAFDVPQLRLSDKINGLQVGGWGAHSPQVPSASLPESLFQELVDKHGLHPGLHKDYATCLNFESTMTIEKRLLEGIRMRSSVCQDLLQRDDWDLFLTVFSETHSGGHIFWQFSQPDHPLYEHFRKLVNYDPLLKTYQEIDKAIGEILTQAPENAHIVIFSAHGMGFATIDMPSFVYLPEFLYRYSFPGKWALAKGDINAPVPPHFTKLKGGWWERHVWGTIYDENPIRRFLRNEIPSRIYKQIEPWLEQNHPSGLISPFELARRGDSPVSFIPAEWYKSLWPSMKAFALPSFAEGYIRINLKGREPQGIVEPSEYQAVCNELCDKLYALREPRNNIPMVEKIVRTRQDIYNVDEKVPYADLIVVWEQEYPADVMDSSDYGRFGPLPYYRSGSHRAEGFILACGSGIKQKKDPVDGFIGHVLDLAPTILELMNAPIPDHLEGKSLELLIEKTSP